MKILRPLCALAIMATLTCGAQKINPMTQAVLNGYSELIEQNPKDYETLYERASQYQQLGMYENALDDIKNAIKYTPQKNSDLREREYLLMSSVAWGLKDYDTALEAINNALDINPKSYSSTYQKGNILLEMNRPEEAYRAFSAMQSLKSRSQEAYFGMARAFAQQGNYGEVESLIKEIENANQNSPSTYCRIGNIYEEMNQPENAAANYIVAIAMDARGNSGIKELSKLAEKDYKAVASALDYAIDKSSNKPMMTLLKGRLANQAGAYQDAELCFSKLIDFPEGKIPSVYTSLAEARLALNTLPEALEAINEAIKLEPSSEAYAIKSAIELAMENTYGAIADASQAIKLNGNNIDAYLNGAAANIAAGNGKEAIDLLNQAIMVAPDNTSALLMRAYANQELEKNAKSALGDLNRIILESPVDFREITIKGIAQSKTGKKMDADADIQTALETMKSPSDLYWGAVYYAQTGDLEKAKTLADQAVYNGFMNKHLLKSSRSPWLNLSPINHLMK